MIKDWLVIIAGIIGLVLIFYFVLLPLGAILFLHLVVNTYL